MPMWKRSALNRESLMNGNVIGKKNFIICIMMMFVFNSWEKSWLIGQPCKVNNEQAAKIVAGRKSDDY